MGDMLERQVLKEVLVHVLDNASKKIEREARDQGLPQNYISGLTDGFESSIEIVGQIIDQAEASYSERFKEDLTRPDTWKKALDLGELINEE